MPLRVAFDMDGVMADFRTAFRAIAGAKQIETDQDDPDATEPVDRITRRDMQRAWRQIVDTANWWTTLEPYEPDQIRRLYDLGRRLRWEVFFVTKRPSTTGETVQYQTQWWLESQGFYLPSVVTVPGSRGEMASALRLDVVVDDQLVNCIEVISASTAKAILMLRDVRTEIRVDATERGIGTVSTLREALDVLERLDNVLQKKRSPFLRLAQWFQRGDEEANALPVNPRDERPLPPEDLASRRNPADGKADG